MSFRLILSVFSPILDFFCFPILVCGMKAVKEFHFGFGCTSYPWSLGKLFSWSCFLLGQIKTRFDINGYYPLRLVCFQITVKICLRQMAGYELPLWMIALVISCSFLNFYHVGDPLWLIAFQIGLIKCLLKVIEIVLSSCLQ